MFYVYENWTHDYVCVHRTDCFCCNNGKGHSGNADTVASPNGKWHGPWSNFADASQVARQLNRAKYYDCDHCKPAAVNPAMAEFDQVVGLGLHLQNLIGELDDYASEMAAIGDREGERREHLLREGAIDEAARYDGNIKVAARALAAFDGAMTAVEAVRTIIADFKLVEHVPLDTTQH